jgi:hypothetical protein
LHPIVLFVLFVLSAEVWPFISFLVMHRFYPPLGANIKEDLRDESHQHFHKIINL